MAKPFENIQKSYETLQLEEMTRGIHTLAVLMSAYYKELLKQGFDEKSALRLTVEYQNTMIRPRVPKAEDDD